MVMAVPFRIYCHVVVVGPMPIYFHLHWPYLPSGRIIQHMSLRQVHLLFYFVFHNKLADLSVHCSIDRLASQCKVFYPRPNGLCGFVCRLSLPTDSPWHSFSLIYRYFVWASVFKEGQCHISLRRVYWWYSVPRPVTHGAAQVSQTFMLYSLSKPVSASLVMRPTMFYIATTRSGFVTRPHFGRWNARNKEVDD